MIEREQPVQTNSIVKNSQIAKLEQIKRHISSRNKLNSPRQKEQRQQQPPLTL